MFILENYLMAVARRPLLRQEAVNVYDEGLEHKNADVRCAAAIALKILKVSLKFYGRYKNISLQFSRITSELRANFEEMFSLLFMLLHSMVIL